MSVRSNDRQEKVISAIQVASFAITVLILFLVVVTVFVLVDTSSSADQIKRSNEFAACRDEISLDVTSSAADVQSSLARLSLVTNLGLEASVKNDDEGLNAALSASTEARLSVVDGIETLDKVIKESQQLSELSIEDPEGFLKACDERNS